MSEPIKKKRGRKALTKEKMVMKIIRMPTETRRLLNIRVAELGTTVQQVVIKLINDFLDKSSP